MGIEHLIAIIGALFAAVVALACYIALDWRQRLERTEARTDRVENVLIAAGILEPE